MIGRTLAHYRLTEAIGAGGMGVVYRATDTRLGRDVALKVLPPETAANADRLERFQREARAVAALNHPSIVTIHSVEEADGLHFLTMELVEGRSLDKLLAEAALPIERIVALGAALADALAAAHEKGIVHRDLKPANIMVGAGGRVKVLDFGLAKMSGSQPGLSSESELPTAAATQDGVVMGTVPYMSPEQVQGRAVDARTDVFSLGVILYEAVTGVRPFVADSTAGLMSAILRDTPRPPSLLRPETPVDLERVIARCLEKGPAARYPSARELAAALTGVGGAGSGALLSRDAGPPHSSVKRAPSGVGARERQAIVVLPFANLSPDKDNEYFSDGLTEELITDLSKVKALSVISRTSAMRLKGTDKDMRTIGRELGVRYVLEGSVRKAGPSLRITAQLVDTTTDAHVWAEKYTGGMDDVFELQERVSREIVKALNVTLTSDEDRRLAQHPVADIKAFELYLRAKNELRGLGVATQHAESLIANAIAIEGETPPLRALLARAKVAQVKAGLGDPARLVEVEATANELLAIDPGSADAHAVLAFLQYERGRLDLAVAHSLRALEREPNDGDVMFYLVVSYHAAGQVEAAAATAARFRECDPLSPMAWMCSGIPVWFTGDFATGISYFERALELDPQNFIVRWTTGYSYTAMGRLPEADEQVAWLLKHGPTIPYTRQLAGLVRALQGRPEEALAFVAPIDTKPLDAHIVFHLAESFAMAGDTGRALDLLDRAVETGFYPYPFIATVCPFLAPLRALPRFPEIRDKARRRVEAFEASMAARAALSRAPG